MRGKHRQRLPVQPRVYTVPRSGIVLKKNVVLLRVCRLKSRILIL